MQRILRRNWGFKIAGNWGSRSVSDENRQAQCGVGVARSLACGGCTSLRADVVCELGRAWPAPRWRGTGRSAGAALFRAAAPSAAQSAQQSAGQAAESGARRSSAIPGATISAPGKCVATARQQLSSAATCLPGSVQPSAGLRRLALCRPGAAQPGPSGAPGTMAQ